MSTGAGGTGSDESVEILRNAADWRPAIGDETIGLIDALRLPTESREAVLEEAQDILARCINPNGPEEQNTGLVVGYVQSGKTLSFTAVAALAHDNGYRMVIVITGTSKALTNQSHDRLRRDLRIGLGAFRPWQHFHNPSAREGDPQRITDVLADWEDPTVPAEERRTVLITVMKHHGRLTYLIKVLQRLNLQSVPVLVIDDEADQAGLNNLILENDESTTYRRLRALRQLLPRHTFLQYTATPQGPLLINIIDVLSPDFSAVLTPGGDYVGGQQFFAGPVPVVRLIPPQDITTPNQPLHDTPDSLLDALRVFFLGVASGLIRRDFMRGNRSMMVHPSQLTVGHAQFFTWVQQVRAAWMQTLEATINNPDDPDRRDLLDSFRIAYDDLRLTVPDIETFDALCERLLHAIRRTEMRLINSLPQASRGIVWGDSYSWILVGGQALDRGFTVEGLTVTYMPRGVGVGNADTVQQRARFFGYKRPYLGYCRVYLEPILSTAFVRYVIHEEDVRGRLIQHANRELPLSELRRAFLLDRSLRPTRASILDIDYVRPITAGWTYPRVPDESPRAVDENRALAQSFLSRLTLAEDPGHPQRTLIQKHFVAAAVPLRRVYDEFLTRLRVPNLTDSQHFTASLIVIDSWLVGHPDATCTIYQISQGKTRERSVDENGAIVNLFQGAYPVHPRERQGEIYRGDREIHGNDNVTIQIHCIDLKESSAPHAPIVAHDVPVVAIWLADEIAEDVIVQNQ